MKNIVAPLFSNLHPPSLKKIVSVRSIHARNENTNEDQKRSTLAVIAFPNYYLAQDCDLHSTSIIGKQKRESQ